MTHVVHEVRVHEVEDAVEISVGFDDLTPDRLDTFQRNSGLMIGDGGEGNRGGGWNGREKDDSWKREGGVEENGK